MRRICSTVTIFIVMVYKTIRENMTPGVVDQFELSTQSSQHILDARELDARTALRFAALDFNLIELLPIGVREVVRLTLLH